MSHNENLRKLVVYPHPVIGSFTYLSVAPVNDSLTTPEPVLSILQTMPNTSDKTISTSALLSLGDIKGNIQTQFDSSNSCLQNVSNNFWTSKNKLDSVINGSNCSFVNANIISIKSTLQTSTNASFSNVCMSTASITNLFVSNMLQESTSASFNNVSIITASVTNLSATNASITNISSTLQLSTNASFSNVCITTASLVNLSVTKINDISANTLSYISNVTSDIQYQLDTILISSGNVNALTDSNFYATNTALNLLNSCLQNVSSNFWVQSSYINSVMNGSNCSFMNASITNISSTLQLSTNASFGNMSITTASILNVSSTNASITNISSTLQLATNASFGNASISTLLAVNSISSDVSAIILITSASSYFSGNVYMNNNLLATQPWVTNIFQNSTNASFSNVSITTASITNLSSTNASITNISSTLQLSTNASFGNVSINNVSSSFHFSTNASFGNVSITTASVTNLSSTNASITNISSINASFSNVSITNASILNNLYCYGNITANNGYFTSNIYAGYSDDRLKIRTSNLSNVLPYIKTLSTFQYYPNTSVCKQLCIDVSNKSDIGMSAQEVGSIFPEIVCPAPCDVLDDPLSGEKLSRTGMNLLTIRYERLVPVLLQAIRELTIRVEELETRII